MTLKTIEEPNFRYQVRFFPPVGEGEKFYFSEAHEVGFFLKKRLENFKVSSLEPDHELIMRWEKDPIHEFSERVQITKIDTNLCKNHHKLYV